MPTEQPITLDQLAKRLRALPVEISGRRGGPLRQALRDIARPLAEQARTDAPTGETGGLSKGVTIKVDPNPKTINNANERIVVSVRRNKTSYYGTFVHWGTAQDKQGPHVARRWMMGVWNSNKSKLVNNFTQAMQKRIGNAVRRAKRAG